MQQVSYNGAELDACRSIAGMVADTDNEAFRQKVLQLARCNMADLQVTIQVGAAISFQTMLPAPFICAAIMWQPST